MIYRQDHIPKNTANNRRPGHTMVPTTITIHNTGNPTSTAANERAWLTNPSNTVTASYHIVVDDKEAIECLPLTESAWHASDGNGPGNRASIGIEICESGDYAQALDNAAALVAQLLRERGWGADRLRRHWDWSGKICPRLMYSNGSWAGWTAFVNMADYKLRTGGEDVNKIAELEGKLTDLQAQVKALQDRASQPVPAWAQAALDAAVAAGLVDTPNGGSYDFYRLVTILHRSGKL